MSRLRDEEIRRALDALCASTDARVRRDADPVSLVHRYETPADREVAGLVAASLAFGNTKTIRAKVGDVLARLGPSPADRIGATAPRVLASSLDGLTHRVWRGEHVARLLSAAAEVRRENGSLGATMRAHFDRTGTLREALARLRDDLYAAAPAPRRAPRRHDAFRHLLPDPRAGSPCKRLNLWLRWMVRRPDGVDLGVWDLSPSILVIPLDVHVHRISRNLGLTRRRTPRWETAEEITARLRAFDPDDPVRYDFAICHLGVARDCPSRRDPVKCGRCVLKDVCLRWARSREARVR